MMDVQIAWNTPLLPLAYGGTTMPLGVAVYLIVALVKHEEAVGECFMLLLVGGAAAAITGLFYGVATGVASQEPLLMWGLVVTVGGIVPAVCGWVGRKVPSSALALSVVSALSAFAGCVALRCAMWVTSAVVNNFFGML